MMGDALTDKLNMNRLFDVYGGLLTDKQREYFQRYYQDDYSLSEVADLFHVSRNAVFDQIQKAAAHLTHYESVLKLEERRVNRLSLYDTLRQAKTEDIAALVDQLERLE
jgi:uncharacterized protein